LREASLGGGSGKVTFSLNDPLDKDQVLEFTLTPDYSNLPSQCNHNLLVLLQNKCSRENPGRILLLVPSPPKKIRQRLGARAPATSPKSSGKWWRKDPPGAVGDQPTAGTGCAPVGYGILFCVRTSGFCFSYLAGKARVR
jgi:hypothetical protein